MARSKVSDFKVRELAFDAELVRKVTERRAGGEPLAKVAKALGVGTGKAAMAEMIGTTERVSPADPAALARAVAKDRRAGASWGLLAARYGVTEGTARAGVHRGHRRALERHRLPAQGERSRRGGGLMAGQCHDCGRPITRAANTGRCQPCAARQIGYANRGAGNAQYIDGRWADSEEGRMGRGHRTARRLHPFNHDFECETPTCTALAVDRHHKDGDTGNNVASNIEFLCKPCHTHKTRPWRRFDK